MIGGSHKAVLNKHCLSNSSFAIKHSTALSKFVKIFATVQKSVAITFCNSVTILAPAIAISATTIEKKFRNPILCRAFFKIQFYLSVNHYEIIIKSIEHKPRKLIPSQQYVFEINSFTKIRLFNIIENSFTPSYNC